MGKFCLAVFLAVLVACAESTAPQAGGNGSGPPGPIPCEGLGWCWERGQPIAEIGGFSLDSVYAIGRGNEFLRWVGGGWESSLLPTEATLRSGHIDADRVAWATDGENRVFRNDGSGWNALLGQELFRVFGAEDGSVWGFGAEGYLHFEQGEWVKHFDLPEHCRGGLDPLILSVDDVWTGGLSCDDETGARLSHYDGSVWTEVPVPGDTPTFTYVGLVDGTVRLHQDPNAEFEWVGGEWLEREFEPFPEDLPSDLRAIRDGDRYIVLPKALDCMRITRLGSDADSNDIWCYSRARVFHTTGPTESLRSWSRTLGDPFESTSSAAWGTLPPSLWVGGDTLHADGHANGSGPDGVFRVQNGGAGILERLDGDTWVPTGNEEVLDISHGDGDTWFATADGLLRSVGESVDPVLGLGEMGGGAASRVQALGPGQVAVVLDRTKVALFDGAWRVVYESSEITTVLEIAGSSPDNLWILALEPGSRAYRTRLEHFNGSIWTAGEWESSVRSLSTHGGATWAIESNLGDGAIRNLDGTEVIELPTLELCCGRLSFEADKVWITTPTQAISRPR